jgi:homoserine O-acetyltransferase
VVGIDSDRLFPVEEQKFIAEAIPGAKYHEITSKFGHDGFLLENDQLTEIIAPLLG